MIRVEHEPGDILMIISKGLSCFVIYNSPTDYPGLWVVRPWVNVGGKIIPGQVGYACEKLECARSHVPADRVNMGRSEDEHPDIFETWM
jgi:hypothetical protein